MVKKALYQNGVEHRLEYSAWDCYSADSRTGYGRNTGAHSGRNRKMKKRNGIMRRRIGMDKNLFMTAKSIYACNEARKII